MEGSDDVDRLTKALEESSLGTKKRFLLVLDLNGLLLDRVFWNNASDEDKRLSGGEKVGNFLMWLRPHATEFAEFVLNNFVVGVWSSAQQHNVDALTQRVFGHRRKELLFQYDQTKCVMVKPHPDPKEKKPLFKKQLKLVERENKKSEGCLILFIRFGMSLETNLENTTLSCLMTVR